MTRAATKFSEASGDAEAGRAALTWLAERPREIVRLDGLARRELWRSAYSEAIDTVAQRVEAGAAGPLGVALASTHWYGRVRERAVRRMLGRPTPPLMPFLVLRTADWVRQVRDQARAGLALLLHDGPESYLTHAVGMAARIEDEWVRGSFAAAQVRAAAVRRPREVWEWLTSDANRAGRRLAFEAVLFTGQLRADELIDIAEADPNPAMRARAAESMVRDALWTTRIQHLRRLSGSRHRQVRRSRSPGWCAPANSRRPWPASTIPRN